LRRENSRVKIALHACKDGKIRIALNVRETSEK